MTVKELIEKLQHLPPDTEIGFHNWQGWIPLQTDHAGVGGTSHVYVSVDGESLKLTIPDYEALGYPKLTLDAYLRGER